MLSLRNIFRYYGKCFTGRKWITLFNKYHFGFGPDYLLERIKIGDKLVYFK